MTRELQEKLESYQRVWAEVDLDAIWENMVHMKENIAEKTKILAGIKTDGYGHWGGSHRENVRAAGLHVRLCGSHL